MVVVSYHNNDSVLDGMSNSSSIHDKRGTVNANMYFVLPENEIKQYSNIRSSSYRPDERE